MTAEELHAEITSSEGSQVGGTQDSDHDHDVNINDIIFEARKMWGRALAGQERRDFGGHSGSKDHWGNDAYKILRRLSDTFFYSIASEAPCERLFSKIRQIIGLHRTRLDSNTLFSLLVIATHFKVSRI
jgi:hypothetical protein